MVTRIAPTCEKGLSFLAARLVLSQMVGFCVKREAWLGRPLFLPKPSASGGRLFTHSPATVVRRWLDQYHLRGWTATGRFGALV